MAQNASKYSKSTFSGDGKAAQHRFIDESAINKYVDGPTFVPPRKEYSPWKKWRPVQWLSHVKVAFEI
jgi:hypothetical protein